MVPQCYQNSLDERRAVIIKYNNISYSLTHIFPQIIKLYTQNPSSLEVRLATRAVNLGVCTALGIWEFEEDVLRIPLYYSNTLPEI